MGGQTTKRQDIQGLRGIAVLLVVFYHAFPSEIPAGYFGVDIFFVISGFLISGLIMKAMDEKSFSIWRFWGNRIKRLLPASYTVILAVIIYTYFFLGGEPLLALAKHVLGAVTFSINFMLPFAQGYFDSDSEFLPLLHMWSLALEEQFYLALPLLLLLCPKNLRIWFFVGLILISVAIRYKAYLVIDIHQSYFFPPTRIWQLALGGLVFLLAQRGTAPRKYAYPVTLGSLLAILMMALWPVDAIPFSLDFHPNRSATIASLFAALLLWLNHQTPWEGKLLRPLRWAGNISYALYLTHWPILAMYRNLQFDVIIAPSAAAGLIALSFAAAAILHYAIERPLHRMPLPSLGWVYGSVLGGATLLVAAAYAALPAKPIKPINEDNGIVEGCESAGEFIAARPCITGKGPKVMLLGDSLAAQLRPALLQYGKITLVQATKAGCAPAMDILQQYAAWKTKESILACMNFMRSTLAALDADDDIKTVILAGNWLMPGQSKGVGGNLYLPDEAAADEISIVPYDRELMAERIAALISQIRRRGIKVVLLSPAPVPAFEYRNCYATKVLNKPLPLVPDCQINLQHRKDQRQHQEELLQLVMQKSGVAIFDYKPDLCDGQQCKASYHGKPLYYDKIHFSPDGLLLYAKHTDLIGRILAAAR